MSTAAPSELLRLWKLEQLSVEMAIGHVLQNLVKQHEMLHTMNTNLAKSNLPVESPISDRPSLMTGKKVSA